MKCVELNKEGHFDFWDLDKLEELMNLKTSNGGNDCIIFQNKVLKLSIIALEPYERIPFKIIENDFNLICLTGGSAISRFSSGKISLMIFTKGENVYHELIEPVMINDLQNIGEDLLVMAIIESKQILPKDHNTSIIVKRGVAVHQ